MFEYNCNGVFLRDRELYLQQFCAVNPEWNGIHVTKMINAPNPGSVLGMVVAGPIGAMVGAGLAVAATQPNAQMFPLLQRGRHSIVNVELPRNGILIKMRDVCYSLCVCVFVSLCFF